MEWVIWVIVIVLIIAIAWWLMNRGGSQSGSTSPRSTEQRTSAPPSDSLGTVPGQAPIADGGMAGAAAAAGTAGIPEAVTGPAAAADEGSGPAPEDAEKTAEAPGPEETFIARKMATADEPGVIADEETAGHPSHQATGVDVDDWDTTPASAETSVPEPAIGKAGQDVEDEEAATGVTADDVVSADPGPGARTDTSPEEEAADRAEWEATWSETPAAPAHHHEYTGPHAPTLPGAESGAAESESSTEDAASDASPGASGTGHLATEHPYGEGSASPTADGSGPEGYPVKGDAGSMTYHDEDTPGYEEATAGVWFISAAHAEAAGFRPPRRNRL